MIEKIKGGDKMRLLFITKQRGKYASSGLGTLLDLSLTC